MLNFKLQASSSSSSLTPRSRYGGLTSAGLARRGAEPRHSRYRSCVHAPSTSLTSNTLTKSKNSLTPHLEHVLGSKGKQRTNKQRSVVVSYHVVLLAAFVSSPQRGNFNQDSLCPSIPRSLTTRSRCSKVCSHPVWYSENSQASW